MPPANWNPPTGPPSGPPPRPADARRALEEAVAAADARDRQLRGEIARLAGARVGLAEDAAAATAEAADGRALAARALGQAEESARAGQRADAARWTGAARVFAMRWRDGRARAADAEAQLHAADETRRRAEAGLAANVAALRQAAATHLAAIGGRRAARLQAAVEETVTALAAPPGDLVARAEQAARAARAEAAAAAPGDTPGVEPVDDEALEDEVDLESVDPLLDDLRAELGIADRSAASGPDAEGGAGPGEPTDPAPPQPRRAAPAARR
jgi:hypothetical protein